MASTHVTLQDVDAIIMELYEGTFVDQNPRLTGGINNIIKFRGRAVSGDGLNIDVKRGRADSFRTDTNPLSDFPGGRRFDPRDYKVRWNENTPGSHDFIKLAGSAGVSEYELIKAANQGTVADIATELVDDLINDYSDKLSMFRLITRTGQIGTTAGAPKLNDALDYASCSAYSTGSTARIVIDTGSISYMRDYRLVDFYNSSGTLVADKIRITDVNPSDSSVGLELSDETTEANLDDLADNDTIYISDTKDKGLYSLGEWFGRPTSGESFIGGRDRTNKDFRWMNPVATREGSSSASIAPEHFDTLGIAMSYAADDNTVPVMLMPPEIEQSFRQQVGHDAFSIMPVQEERFKKFAHYGRFGVMYQHPTFGTVMFQSHNMMPQNTVWAMVPDTWQALQYGQKGLKRMPGEQGFWYREQSTVAGAGKGMFYRTDAYANHCDICKFPQKNGTILNVTA